MKNILFIHQSADLYGSDKTLLYLVEAVKNKANPIVVVPEEGPLTIALREIGIEVIISPVIKVSRQLYASSKILKLPFLISSAVKALNSKLGQRKIDLVHSNTLAVFLGAFYSKKYKIKHIWHVHEIIKSPKIAAVLYPFIVNYYSDIVIFNSKASFNHLTKSHRNLAEKSQVIYNGLDREIKPTTSEERFLLKQKYFPDIDNKSIVLGLVGRINKHKGQHLLLDAFEKLVAQGKNIKLVFIGSTTPLQHFLLEKLEEAIVDKALETKVKIISFQNNLWKYYDFFDIVLVPTTDPEPFGLVALEGMLSRKPVIASNHGGLKEIVVHEETGLLFEPNNQDELQKAIDFLIQNPVLIDEYGENGYNRAINIFSLKKYNDNFLKLYDLI